MKKLLNYSNFNKLAIVIITLCLVVGLYTGYQRINHESKYKSVEISLDYEEMLRFSESTDKDLEYWLKKFKSLGAVSVSIQEETINTLIKSGYDIKKYIVSELPKSIYTDREFPDALLENIKNNSISVNDSIIKVSEKDMFDYLMEGLSLRYPEEFYSTYISEGDYYIVLSGIVDDIYYTMDNKIFDIFGKAISETRRVEDSRLFNIGVGYSKEKIELAKECGLDVILRPFNYTRYPEKLVAAYDFENQKYGLVPRLYITVGKDVIGYPTHTAYLVEYLRKNNAMPVLIEANNQRENLEQGGINGLVENLNYSTVRGFTLWDWLRQRYKVYGYEGAEEIENSIYRAVTERNIRFVMFKPFYEGTYKYLTNEAEYEKTFNNLAKRLDAHNIKFGKASSINEFSIGNFRLGILCVGVALASVYLFNNVLKIHNIIGIALYILSFGAFFAPFVTKGLSEKVFALLAAIAFSGIAIYYFMTMIKRIRSNKKELSRSKMIIFSLTVFVITCLISLAGATFIIAILSNVRYMVELEIFRGVKVAQLFPFVIYIIILVLQFINNNNEDNSIKTMIKPIKNILNADIKVYYVLLAGILGAIGYIYIARTGHETNVQPSNIEIIIRNFLENVLIARPRSKEFLFAFPAMLLAIFVANKKIPFVTEAFMLMSVIGTTSIINTFCHIRTPLYLSIYRTLISMCFGAILGCIAIIIINEIYKIITKVQVRLK